MYCNHEYTNQEGRALEKLVTQLEQQLAAANARIAELEYKLMAQTETALQEKAKREQAEAQCKRMEEALREITIVKLKGHSYVEDCQDAFVVLPEIIDIAKAALEEKP
jgi:TolA-binding protein